jgi:hypothetical protein
MMTTTMTANRTSISNKESSPFETRQEKEFSCADMSLGNILEKENVTILELMQIGHPIGDSPLNLIAIEQVQKILVVTKAIG